MTYYKRKIDRLWNNYASVKDYEVEKAILKGGAILTLVKNNEQMILSVDQLREGLKTRTGKSFNPNPRLNEKEPYKLCNFYWQKSDTRQGELI
jgi:hypothetical protein